MAGKKKTYRTISNPGWKTVMHNLFVGKNNLPVIYYRNDRFTIPHKHKNVWCEMEFTHVLN